VSAIGQTGTLVSQTPALESRLPDDNTTSA